MSWLFFIGFVCGLGLLSAALDVYVRDLRYVVESVNLVLFWLVPIWYGFEQIAPEYRTLYGYNPAAMVMAMRRVNWTRNPRRRRCFGISPLLRWLCCVWVGASSLWSSGGLMSICRPPERRLHGRKPNATR